MDNCTLTIQLEAKDGHLPLSSFVTVVASALSLLKGIDRELAGRRERPVRWEVTDASLNSPLTLEIGAPGTDVPQRVEMAISQLINGLDLVELEPVIPDHFTDSMMESAKQLVSVLNDGVGAVHLLGCGRRTRPTQRVAANTDEALQAFETPIVLEGLLQMVNVHDGQKFAIYDEVTDERVPCVFVDEELRFRVKDALYERVTVYGVATYDHHGNVRRVCVDRLEPLVERRETIHLFATPPVDITGGMDPADYIEGLHEDDEA